MTQSVKLALEYLQNSAANQVLANTTFAQLDQLVQAGAVDKDLSSPPGSPANGALYIVASSPTGAWSGKTGQLAFWLTSANAWSFIVPREGFLVHVNDEDKFYKFNGSSWEVFSGGGSSGVASIVAGTGISVDNADPSNPIVSATGGGGSGGAVQTVAISSGSLNLSGISASVDTVKVTLDQNITSITLPAGSAGYRKDLLIQFTQDATGGRTVTGWPSGVWATAPSITATALAATLVGLMNVDNGGWKGLPASSSSSSTTVPATFVLEKSSGTWKISTSFRNIGASSVSANSSAVRVNMVAGTQAYNFVTGLVGSAAVLNGLKVSARWDSSPATYVELVFGNGTSSVDPTSSGVPDSTYYVVVGT